MVNIRYIAVFFLVGAIAGSISYKLGLAATRGLLSAALTTGFGLAVGCLVYQSCEAYIKKQRQINNKSKS